MTLSLTGKTALITGSTSGIGEGIARKMAVHGANIILNGLGDSEKIGKIRTEIEHHNVQCRYIPADMSKPNEIEALIKKAGNIDILVNNAGIQHVSPIENFPPEKWDQIIAINLSASFHTIRHCIPIMRANGWGRIVNIASAHALVASPYKSAYVAAKHGILGLTKTIALETAQDGITANAICPGYVKTPLVENQIKDTANARNISEEEVVRDVLLAAQWTKDFVSIDQVAELALFLCSDAAKNITGSAQSIDGGWTAA